MKLIGFPERLVAFVESRETTPYAWGSNDCATFLADAVIEVRGTDLLEGLRGSWSNQAEAQAVLDAQGGLIAFLDSKLPRRHVNYTQRGDVCLIRDSVGNPSLAICTGSVCAAPGPEGVERESMNKVLMVWET